MVVRVEGIINGDPIIFQRIVGDQWEAKAPASLDGTYVLEMTAYDEAGNVASKSLYLLAYDPVNLCVKLQKLPYIAELKKDLYQSKAYLSKYFPEKISTNWGVNVRLSNYYAVLVEQKCCGR